MKDWCLDKSLSQLNKANLVLEIEKLNLGLNAKDWELVNKRFYRVFASHLAVMTSTFTLTIVLSSPTLPIVLSLPSNTKSITERSTAMIFII